MNNQDNETLDGVQILIVSFGEDGNTAAEILAQTHLMQPSASKYGRCIFAKLTPMMAAKDIEAIIRNIHMAFILGSDSQIDYQSAISLLIKICHENSILCYSILSIKNSVGADNEITTRCRQANNTLLIPADKSTTNVRVCDLMKEAVLNITNSLLGTGVVAVDFDDIKTVMQRGKTAQFSIAEAAGKQRAKQAAHSALQCLPSASKSASMICNIECGGDFQLDEFNTVTEAIEAAVSEQCLIMTCSTFNPIADAWKVRITAFY